MNYGISPQLNGLTYLEVLLLKPQVSDSIKGQAQGYYGSIVGAPEGHIQTV